ncbi:MAG: alpha/beta hydrolase [SAR202 cluster bacterium]|nr:alpha/beta hydrolase [SAR202 cluster bacterium]
MALTEEGIIHVPGLYSRYVRLANGSRAHYMTAGETGPAVVLLHGGIAGSSGLAGWRFMAPFLAKHGFRVYCPDMPGFGLADTREAFWPKLGQISHLEFVREFVDALCLDNFHIAGNSMGCMNTVNFVTAYPERVLSFALIAGGIGDLAPFSGTRPSVDVTQFDGSAKSMREMMEAIILRKEAITDELVEMRVAAAARHKDAYPYVFGSMQTIARDPNLSARISTKGRFDKLTIPGIYLYGKQDVLIPVQEGYKQEDATPNIQYFYPDDCGHQGQTDQPEMFAQVFMEFFKYGKVSRKTADWAGVSKRRPENPRLVELATSRRART